MELYMALARKETTIEQPGVGTKQRGTRFPVVSLVLGTLSLIGMIVSIWMIFLYAPTDAVQGWQSSVSSMSPSFMSPSTGGAHYIPPPRWVCRALCRPP